MILRGFKASEGRNAHTWCYRKGKEPFLESTKTLGANDYFYGEPNGPADKNITVFEGKTQQFVKEARAANDGEAVDPEKAATLIAHMEMRTKFLRSELRGITEQSLARVNSHFEDPEKLRLLLRQYLKANPEELDEYLGDACLNQGTRPAALALVDMYLERMDQEKLLKAFGGTDEFTRCFAEYLADVGKKAQISMMEEDFEKAGRRATYLETKFAVIRFSRPSLILPDTYLAFLCDRKPKPFIDAGDRVEEVFVPMSSDSLLYGFRKRSGQNLLLSDLTPRRVNSILATCAFEEFYASEDRSDFRKLSSKIGKNAHLMSKQELASITSFSSLLNEV